MTVAKAVVKAPAFIPLSVPEMRGNAWAYLKECVDTNWVSSVGPFVDRFEREIAATIGTRHAVATTSGTAALHIALLAAGVQPNDEVLVSTLTFIASANAIRYCGAWPVFIDAEQDYWQMDPAAVRRVLQRSCRMTGDGLMNVSTGRRVSAIMPVHVLGHPCDMDPILALAKEHRLVVVEDAAESLGTRYRGRPVGRLGDVAALSFNGNKIITAGGGGMVVSDDEAIARRARHLTTQAKSDPVESIHDEIGFNYRLTNIQAALGCSQLELLDEYLAAKQRTAGAYEEGLRGVRGLTLMRAAPWAEPTWWNYTVRVDPVGFGMDNRDLLRELRAQAIETRPLWQPLHQSAAHRGTSSTECPVAERIAAEALSLPSSVGLTTEQQQRVIAAIRAAAGN